MATVGDDSGEAALAGEGSRADVINCAIRREIRTTSGSGQSRRQRCALVRGGTLDISFHHGQ